MEIVRQVLTHFTNVQYKDRLKCTKIGGGIANWLITRTPCPFEDNFTKNNFFSLLRHPLKFLQTCDNAKLNMKRGKYCWETLYLGEKSHVFFNQIGIGGVVSVDKKIARYVERKWFQFEGHFLLLYANLINALCRS